MQLQDDVNCKLTLQMHFMNDTKMCNLGKTMQKCKSKRRCDKIDILSEKYKSIISNLECNKYFTQNSMKRFSAQELLGREKNYAPNHSLFLKKIKIHFETQWQ